MSPHEGGYPGPSLDAVRNVLGAVLELGPRTASLTPDSPLLGGLPELDSMAVITVVIELEEHFGIRFDEEDVTAEAFETLGSLTDLVDRTRGI